MNICDRKKITLKGKNMVVISYNIRCMTPDDKGERSWHVRAPLVCDILEESEPAIIGFQETKVPQLRYLKKFLEGYECINTYRDKSLFKESNPLFFRIDMFNMLDSGTFWLTSTPDVISKEWDSNCYRICTFAVLEDKKNKNKFMVMNTHLDHRSALARINGIKVIAEKIKKYNLPTLLMGDFNAKRDEDTITFAKENFEEIGENFDDYKNGSFNDYIRYEKAKCSRIDYIFQTKNGFDVNDFKIIDKTYNKVFPSDHFPLFTIVKQK